MSDSDNSGGGCGCGSLIFSIILIVMLFWGLPTPWGKLNLDIFPPRIWDMNAEVATDE